jgi:hypothetical protein
MLVITAAICVVMTKMSDLSGYQSLHNRPLEMSPTLKRPSGQVINERLTSAGNLAGWWAALVAALVLLLASMAAAAFFGWI